VRAGAVLLRIENRDYQAKVDRAQADVAAAQAAVAADEAAIANIEAQVAQQRDVIAQAEALGQSAAADAKRTQLDYSRYRSLVGQQVASRQRLEMADADYRKANASVARVHAAVAAERGKLPVLETQRKQAEAALDQARATLKAAQAALALAQIDLDNTVLRAPIDGTVGQRMVRLGQYVEPGMPLLAVVPLQAAYVIANYKETQLSDMRPGQPAEIQVDSFPGRPLRGRVGSFSPASGSQFALLPPDNATGNFTKIVQRIPVKILIEPNNPLAGLLRPGMSVIATVDTRGGSSSNGAAAREAGDPDGR
jgi:membrane fusion protein (multidrug efflux system)